MNKITRNQWIAVAVALVVVGVGYVAGGSLFSMFGNSDESNMSMNNDQMTANTSDAMVPPAGLEITDVTVGTGAEAKSGNTVTLNYTGAFTDGQIFDASANHGQPISFVLGSGQVIKGWDQGIVGMKVGGKRHLVIPSDLAYGDMGYPGAIPPKATLIFDVELLEVK